MDATNLADLYGTPLARLGSRSLERLDEGVSQAPGTGGPDRHTCWLATINRRREPTHHRDRCIWVDGAFWFETGEHTRKGRNLARDPRCTLSVATHEFDLVVDGEAHVVTEPAIVADMARRWSDEGWPARAVDESGSAITADYSALVGRVAALVGVPTGAAAPRTGLLTVDPGGATRAGSSDRRRRSTAVVEPARLMGEHAEGVVLGIGQDDPARVVGLADVDAAGSQGEEAGDLGLLIVRVEVEVQRALPPHVRLRRARTRCRETSCRRPRSTPSRRPRTRRWYPRTSHQKVASRRGSSQSTTTLNQLDAIGASSASTSLTPGRCGSMEVAEPAPRAELGVQHVVTPEDLSGHDGRVGGGDPQRRLGELVGAGPVVSPAAATRLPGVSTGSDGSSALTAMLCGAISNATDSREVVHRRLVAAVRESVRHARVARTDLRRG